MMNHQEYRRILPGSDMAVLMLHGIVGTPHHFDDLIPLIPENWSVVNLLLEGHGQGAAEFGAASMDQWKGQVSRELDALLAYHEKVLIVGHSMGTLFAIQSAIDCPDRVAGLFLQAVPLRPYVHPKMTLASAKLMLDMGVEEDPLAQALERDSGVEVDWRLWKYTRWPVRFVELLAECERIRRELPRLQVPTIAVQSRRDELVSDISIRDLQKNPCVRVVEMEQAGHFGYEGEEQALMLQCFREMIADCACRGR